MGLALPGEGMLSRSLESVKQEESGSVHTLCPAPARVTPLRSPAGTWQGWAGLGRALQGQRWLGRALCLPWVTAGLGALRIPANSQGAPPAGSVSCSFHRGVSRWGMRMPLLPGTKHSWATALSSLLCLNQVDLFPPYLLLPLSVQSTLPNMPE